MQEFEIADLIRANQLMNPHLDFSTRYTFYYDETNNFRKLHIINEQGFNNSVNSNFVLGGFLYEDDKPNLDSLVSGLRLQPTVTEIKLKHLAKGDFLECLKSSKLDYFLNYMLNSNLFAHYSSINPLYYSIVDIVDSAILESSVMGQLDIGFINGLKDTLYRLCKLELPRVTNLFYRYQYPNIKSNQVLSFIQELTDLFSDYEDQFEFHLGLTSIKQMLKEASKKNPLTFVMDEEDHVLMKDFFHLYFRLIYTFKNSEHILDREESIIDEMNGIKLAHHGIPFQNHEFRDSKSDLLIQLSDVFVGLVGKLSTFINTLSPVDIEREITNLTSGQKNCLDAFLKVIVKSDQKNQAFFHNVNGLSELDKFKLIFNLRGYS